MYRTHKEVNSHPNISPRCWHSPQTNCARPVFLTVHWKEKRRCAIATAPADQQLPHPKLPERREDELPCRWPSSWRDCNKTLKSCRLGSAMATRSLQLLSSGDSAIRNWNEQQLENIIRDSQRQSRISWRVLWRANVYRCTTSIRNTYTHTCSAVWF